ncbi:hypothetical protein QJS10_CPB12g01717 [Acorus calamus]|uniref:Transcription elongation factor spt6 n=1 Tax=Acorus calamus TaxID=4465 RepID=A0AAV9DLT0_ACOCL|nr:hypothetical protein QJS10_CPB12g01717 [Acorus calamus]
MKEEKTSPSPTEPPEIASSPSRPPRRRRLPLSSPPLTNTLSSAAMTVQIQEELLAAHVEQQMIDDDEYEKDGFIVDSEEEGEEEDMGNSDVEERQNKKKRKKKESLLNYVLDDEDYELLEDNNISVLRPKPVSNRFKRLKKFTGDGEQEYQSGYSDEEEHDMGEYTAEEKLKHSLFGDDEVAPLEDIIEDEEQPEEEDGDLGEEDEMRDFIISEDEVDENSVSVRRKKSHKKKLRPGVSSSALQEAHEIFGDVDEFLMLRKAGSHTDVGFDIQRLEDELEPLIIAEKYLTARDKDIRKKDVPERIQLSEETTGPPPKDDGSIEKESHWIYSQLTSSLNPPLVLDEKAIERIDVADIANIPFIAMYRKEICRSLLKDPGQDEMDNYRGDRTEMAPMMRWHRVLWAINDLNTKWLLLQKQKTVLKLYYSKRFEVEARRLDDEIRLTLNRQIFVSVMEALEGASSEREVDDVELKFNLHFPPEKKPNNEPEDAKETPEQVAANFTCTMFATPHDVLRGARHMAAVELSCEPLVRKHVRVLFMDKALVSTSPTAEGNTAIDSFHQFAGVKWLQNKPIREFTDAQWLLILKAEEEKLLQVTIRLSDDDQNKLINESIEYYVSLRVSEIGKLWNEQRRLIITDSYENFILPSVVKEAQLLLTARAKNWLLAEYGKQLWSKVSVAPCQRGNDSTSEDAAALRVLACCWGPGKPATTFVMLDSSGEMVDVLYTSSISIRSRGLIEQQRKKNDEKRLQKFLIDHQPHIVGVGAANLACKNLMDDICEAIFELVQERPRDIGYELDSSRDIIFFDESLPRLYENSRISSDQLPSQPGIVKRAVALGRYLQNPLAMVATLCGPGREILSWKLSSLDHFLTPDEKYGMVEQVMIDATNQIGIDVNLAASHEWMLAPLQFISGLGPRKASSLRKDIVRRGLIHSRKDLYDPSYISKKVLINAAGFLRVRRSGMAANTNSLIDLLDDTRINPESYQLAKSMAKDVYDEDVPEDQAELDEDAQEIAVEYVREKPNLLKLLNIDVYAKSDPTRVQKLETLYDIKMELLHGFQDWRTPFSELTTDEVFAIVTGETDDTLLEGRFVQATVSKVLDERVICTLDCGLTGLIFKDGFTDEQGDDWKLSDKVSEGDILNCRVKSVRKERLQVVLTYRRDLRDARDYHPNYIRNRDKYYKEVHTSLQTEQEKALKGKVLAKKHLKPRMIVHPRFQNWTADEAIKYLSNKDPGESIIRPSSRGPSFLTLTLKVYGGVYAHKDITEGGKDHKDITSLLRLGKTLTIGEDTFEDLDEVMDRYVDPLVYNLKTMLGYRTFRRGSKSEVDDLLRAEKAEYPTRIVYAFGISHEYPGTFILSYIRSLNPHHEYVGLYPKGFKFRKIFFEDIDRLVNYFQKNVDKLPSGKAHSLPSVAAGVPMRSPASGGESAWGSSDGGWRGQSNSERDRSSNSQFKIRKFDYNRGDNGGGGRDRHPSGAPRLYTWRTRANDRLGPLKPIQQGQ